MSDLFVGIDVGGTKIATATLRDGKLSESGLAHTELDDQDALLEQLVTAVEDARGPCRARRIRVRVPTPGVT